MHLEWGIWECILCIRALMFFCNSWRKKHILGYYRLECDVVLSGRRLYIYISSIFKVWKQTDRAKWPCRSTAWRTTNIKWNTARNKSVPSRYCTLASRYKIAAILLFVLGNEIQSAEQWAVFLALSLPWQLLNVECEHARLFLEWLHVLIGAEHCATLPVFIQEGNTDAGNQSVQCTTLQHPVRSVLLCTCFG